MTDREAGDVLPRLSADDRSLVPLTVLHSTTVALWLIVYLICVAGDSRYAASFDPHRSLAR